VRIWRISNHTDLSGRGGELSEGRWHQLGTPLVYCSDHPATTLLEMLARIGRFEVPDRFQLLAIDIPDDASSLSLDPAALPSNWRRDIEVTRRLGTELLERADHLSVRVPCVLVPFAWNVLLNPRHPAIGLCSIAEIVKTPFDPRLLQLVGGAP
jgi:RES domain-containing protein